MSRSCSGRPRGSTPDIADWLYDFLGDNRGVLSANRASHDGLKLPAAIIWGDLDTVTPVEQAQDLYSLIQTSKLTYLAGIGHIPQIEDPDRFNEALLNALKRL